MKTMFLMIAVLLGSCATSTKPAAFGVRDVLVGDTLAYTEAGKGDCALVVDNIVTIIATPEGLQKVPAVVCGMMECPVTMPGLPPVGACIEITSLKKVEPKVKAEAKEAK